MDQSRVEKFQERLFTELNAGMSCLTIQLGHRLGFIHALAEAGPLTPTELATRTGCSERYVREWLECMAAGEYVEHEAATGRFSLPPEHAAVLLEPDNPASAIGVIGWMPSLSNVMPELMDAFRTGGGVPYKGPKLADLSPSIAQICRELNGGS